MASCKILTKLGLFWQGVDMTPYIMSASIDAGASTQNQTTMTDDTAVSCGSLLESGFGFGGVWNPVLDKQLFDDLGLSDGAYSIAYNLAAAGEYAYLIDAVETSYNPISGAVGDLHAWEVSGGANDLARGIVLDNAIITATGESADQTLDASTAKQIIATAHVSDITGTLDIKIESDDNAGFTSPVTQFIFSQFTAVGGQLIKLDATGITDTFWRVSDTVGGGSPSSNRVVSIGLTY